MIVAGTGNAPEQFRIAIAQAAQFLCNRVPHLHLSQAFLAFDAFFVMASAVGLYLLLRRELQSSPASVQVASRALLGFWMAYYLHWTFLQTRAETAACIFYTVFALLLCGSILDAATGAIRVAASAALILLSFGQGWVRADVAVILCGSVALACLLPGEAPSRRSRLWLLFASSASALASGGALEYITHRLYPHARRGGAAFVLADNLAANDWRGICIFLLVALPTVAVALAFARRFATLTLLQRALLFAAPTYLALWSCLGLWPEPRIFVPFGMALAPTLAVASASFAERFQEA
jgi:hypothetical protein